MTTRLRLLLLAILLALCGLLAACGGSTQHQTAAGSVHPPGWGRPAPLAERVQAPLFAAGTTASMFDSTDVGTVPSSPFALAGYTSGFWPTFLPMRSRWPHAHVISIAISTSNHADCLDVEPGDATPGQVVGWVHVELRLGWRHPCVYSSWWEYHNEIDPLLARAGLLFVVFKWSADYTFHAHIDRGFQATQWTDKALGRNLDESLVLKSFLSIAHPPYRPSTPKPKPAPKPAPKPPSHRALEGRLRTLNSLLGAYDRRTNRRGHNCAHPPYRHAYPSARYNAACAAWAREAAATRKALRR